MTTAYYFSAPWCVPCRTFKPQALPLLNEASIPVTEINVDEDEELTQAFRVHSVPTIVIMGDEPDQAYGPANEKGRTVGAYIPSLKTLIAEVTSG